MRVPLCVRKPKPQIISKYLNAHFNKQTAVCRNVQLECSLLHPPRQASRASHAARVFNFHFPNQHF